MFPLILLTALICLVAGLIAKWYFDNDKTPLDITWTEFAVTSAIICMVIIPIVSFVGWRLSVNNQVTYNEFWNGWETRANWVKIKCSRDGPCRWEYSCDPYVVCVSCNCGKNGCSTCCHTEYHSCPYCTEEWSFSVNSTVGDFWIDEYRLPHNPNAFIWRNGHDIPERIINEAGVGVPKRWSEVKTRLDSGYPGPVTVRRQYENYIIASDLTILKQFGGDIAFFDTLRILPKPADEIFDFYYADKVAFVGAKTHNTREWQKRLMYLNAELGNRLQGDLHLIIVNSPTINENPDRYAIALKSQWQNKIVLKKNTTGQNSIIVIIGTRNDSTVDWVRATTGMPIGNELMLSRIQSSLVGKSLVPDSIIGVVRRDLNNQVVSVVGGLAKITLYDPPTRFKRVKMELYLYLKNEIKPTTAAYIWMIILSFIVAGLCWIYPITHNEDWRRYRSPSNW